jgi:phage tail-like protein
MSWPPPTIRFIAELPQDPQHAQFQKLSGPDAAPNAIALSRGSVARNSELFRWWSARSDAPKTLIVRLLNENNIETMSWTLVNAVPLKFVAFDDGADDVAIDRVELKFESVTRTPPTSRD